MWEFWDGQFVSDVVAFDTETTVVPDPSVQLPTLVLATASDGNKSYVLRPPQLDDFFLRHRGCHVVCHNVAFDFWVVNHPVLWEMAESNRLHDTMLLDQLVRLAEGKGVKGGIPRRNLGALSLEYCPEVAADKESPFRTRFGELLTMMWELAPREFFDYAAVDAVATRRIYDKLLLRATELFSPELSKCWVGKDCVARYGILTESLQVRAALSLADITRRGIAFDRPYATSLEAELREAVRQDWEFLLQDCPELFHVDKKGSYVLTKKGKTYSMRTEVLRNTLSSAATAIGQPVFQSAGKNKAVSTSAKLWVQYADRVPFIGAWTRTVTSKDLLKFFDIFGSAESDRVHPRYDTLKNTGRTGSSRPNIQQTPRNGKFRRCYVAPAGKLLAVVDYSFIELRTLAAVCYATYGRSVLGDVIKAGVDPHAYTAAMINGLDLDAFLALKKSDPDKFKGDRQAAKALNFGIPGGLGPRKLVDYARTTYKVTMSIEQAREFRHRLVTDIYPELNDADGYLASTYHLDVARNLNLPVESLLDYLRNEFRGRDPMRALYLMGRVLKGQPTTADGTKYDDGVVARCWKALNHLVRQSGRTELFDPVARKEGSRALYMQVYRQLVTTVTGRMRDGTDYTDARNTPFQSLAADGAKVALWNLMRRGKQVVAFVHDEIIAEVPAATAEQEREEIEHVMCESMAEVLNHLVPVACEGVVTPYWVKG